MYVPEKSNPSVFEGIRRWPELNHAVILEFVAEQDFNLFVKSYKFVAQPLSEKALENTSWVQKVNGFIEENKLVSAIKTVRDHTSLALKEAKDVVDTLIKRDVPTINIQSCLVLAQHFGLAVKPVDRTSILEEEVRRVRKEYADTYSALNDERVKRWDLKHQLEAMKLRLDNANEDHDKALRHVDELKDAAQQANDKAVNLQIELDNAQHTIRQQSAAQAFNNTQIETLKKQLVNTQVDLEKTTVYNAEQVRNIRTYQGHVADLRHVVTHLTQVLVDFQGVSHLAQKGDINVPELITTAKALVARTF
jgi:hypothetical protein